MNPAKNPNPMVCGVQDPAGADQQGAGRAAEQREVARTSMFE